VLVFLVVQTNGRGIQETTPSVKGGRDKAGRDEG
jgi:hypothetical protein